VAVVVFKLLFLPDESTSQEINALAIAAEETMSLSKKKTGTLAKHWGHEESQRLLQLVSQFGEDWKTISECLPNNRTPAQCRERFIITAGQKNGGAKKVRSAGLSTRSPSPTRGLIELNTARTPRDTPTSSFNETHSEEGIAMNKEARERAMRLPLSAEADVKPTSGTSLLDLPLSLTAADGKSRLPLDLLQVHF